MEKCQVCGEKYLTIWTISDEQVWKTTKEPQNSKLYERITGIQNGSGMFCIPCIDKMAMEKNITLYWQAMENKFPIERIYTIQEIARITKLKRTSIVTYHHREGIGFNYAKGQSLYFTETDLKILLRKKLRKKK